MPAARFRWCHLRKTLPLRTAVIGDEISQDIFEVVRLVKEHNFAGVEVRSAFNKSPLDLNKADCVLLADVLGAAALFVAGFASPSLKVALPRSSRQRAEARATLELSITRAEWLAAPVVRIFSFLRSGEPNPIAAADAVGNILNQIGQCPVELVVETGTRTNTPSAATMRTFLQQLDNPAIHVLWDPGNGIFSGHDLSPYPTAYETLKECIGHVHVKDPIGNQHYTQLGNGDVPWAEIFKRLIRDDFAGYVSLETHWRMDRVLTHKERDDPYGLTFSDGGYQASKRCMTNLVNMIQSPP